MIGSDNVKRLVPGSDEQIRLVRLVTSRGQLLRPIQRIYPLESGDPVAFLDEKEVQDFPKDRVHGDDFSEPSNVKIGSDKSRVPAVIPRSGRQVKTPSRFSSC